MPDYSLGRAHGEIQIDYNGNAASRAARDLDKVADSSEAMDKSLDKSSKTLRDTERSMDSAGTSAQGYQQRLRDVERASRDADAAEDDYRKTLLDTRSTLDDIKDAEKRAADARKEHGRATAAARDAHRAFSADLNLGQRTISALANVIPRLSDRLDGFADSADGAASKATGMAGSMAGLARIVGAFGAQGKAAAAGLLLLSSSMDKVQGSGSFIGDFVRQIVDLEAAVGKIGGIVLGATSLGGLAGIGGAASVQGVVNMAGAVKQLSGAFALLPSVIGAVAFTSTSLDVAFRGVGDALSAMMDDDPTKFLESIKDMAPSAANALLQVAQFRDAFKFAGGFVQDSFFKQIANDIAPLIQTWLPQVTAAMGSISAMFGQAAHQLAGLLQQPEMMASFQQFIANVNQGLAAMQPAMAPLLEIFTQLSVVGSSFFGQIGDAITQILDVMADGINAAAQSGALQEFIQGGITGFLRLADIVTNLGSVFVNVMNIAEKFGGGGLLAWLDDLAIQLNNWTQSAEGQQALTTFFSALREATNAFTPLLKPLVEGIASIATAFTQLGVGISPGWQAMFDAFAQTMADMAPQIVAIAPALNQFLRGLANAFSQLMAQLGPQLPQIFQTLSDAFIALLPQIGPLVDMFLDLATRVGPMLPTLFQTITEALITLERYWPLAVGFVRMFISAVNGVVGAVTAAVHGVEGFVEDAADLITGWWDKLTTFFSNIGTTAANWGRNLISGLVDGIQSGLGAVGGVTRKLVEAIAEWFQSSPAKRGPFSGSGYTMIRGRQMVTDMAAGMASAQPSLTAAAASTAGAAAGALDAGMGGAPSATGSGTAAGSLLPDWIAGADSGPLTAYLSHQFSDSRGLKGLAKDLGGMLDLLQSGTNLISQNLLQPLFQGLGMMPGADTPAWRKKTAAELARDAQKDALKAETKDQGPTWQDVFGPGAAGSGGADASVATSPAAGNAQLVTALQEKGFSAQLIRLIQGFSEVEGNNPAGNPTLGFTDSQLGGASDLQSHVDALAKQFVDRASVAGVFPEGGSDREQAEWIARVVGQAGLASDWQGNAQPQDYVERVMSALPGAAPAAGTDKPTWGMVTGQKTYQGRDAQPNFYSDWYKPAGDAAAPPGTYGLPTGTDTGGYGSGTAGVFPQWVMDLAEQFGVKPSTYGSHQESDRNEAGYAPNPQRLNRGIDWVGTVENMQRFAEYMQSIAPTTPGLEQIIWENPETMQRIGLGGNGNPTTGYYPDYGEGSYAEHRNHVHTRQSTGLPLPGGPIPLAAQQQTGVGASATSGLVLPSGANLDDLLAESQQNTSVNEQLLQSYLQGNPALAQQISAAQVPGAADDTVMSTLTDIGKTIDTLRAEDAVGNKNTIDALQSQQRDIANAQGYTQTQNGLQQAQSIASQAAGAVGGIYKAAQSGLEALAATQDIADRLVYGVRNTEDINKIIDNVQKYITFAADVLSAAGSIVSMVGSATGGSDFGGTSAAGQALSLVSSILQGVNAAIDFGQQIYEITSGYVGRFMSVLTGLGGTDLMGNVGFLLNKNTGELISYSMDNPGQKNTHEVPSWMNGWYDYNGKGNPNPQVNQQLNIYAGPGQSTAEMMNETMWLVNNGGTTGALSPAAF